MTAGALPSTRHLGRDHRLILLRERARARRRRRVDNLLAYLDWGRDPHPPTVAELDDLIGQADLLCRRLTEAAA